MSKFPNPINYTPLNDYPIITDKLCRVLFIPQTCKETGARIPRLAMAWQRKKEYLIRDMIETEIEWYTEEGYIIAKLKGNV